MGKYVIFATQLSHFINWPISVRLNEEHFTFTFHLQYKHSGTFVNREYEELSYPKKSGNVRPHPGNSIENTTSRENATLSSGTSPLASHKEVPPRFPPIYPAFHLRSPSHPLQPPILPVFHLLSSKPHQWVSLSPQEGNMGEDFPKITIQMFYARAAYW